MRYLILLLSIYLPAGEQAASKFLKKKIPSPWTQDVNWMYIRRWGDAQDISESLMCVEFTSCVQGEKKASSLLLLLTAFFHISW